MATDKPLTARQRAAAGILLALCAVAAARSLFTGLEIDEEYALSISYRLLRGDTLFYTMWEPHQLSSLTAAPLLALFMAVTGGTAGVLLFIRAVLLVVKAALGVWAYRLFRGDLGRFTALLLALVLFLYTPKWFLGPDYISQQYHYTLASFLCLYSYYNGKPAFRRVWPVAAGAVCACLSYLAFPQSIVAVLPLMAGLWLLGARNNEPRLWHMPRGAAVFFLTCAVCGIAFMLYVFSALPPAMLLPRLSMILHDPQYDASFGQRLAQLGRQAVPVLRFWALPCAAAAVYTGWQAFRQKRQGSAFTFVQLADRFLPAAGLFVLLWCTVYAIQDSAIDMRHYLPVVMVLGAWVFWRDRRAPGSRARAALFWLGYLPGLAAYLMILRSSLLGLAPTFMYLTFPALCGVAALALPTRGRSRANALLGAWLLFLVVCRVWLVLLTGWSAHNTLDTPLRLITGGPAAGIWADEPAADMQAALEEALSHANAGDNVLLTTGDIHGLAFLMNDGTLRVGQASVISSTDSDARFAAYYKEFPDKTPDIILYDDHCVRDLDEFHAWLEASLPITERFTVTHGTASLQVLLVAEQ